MHPCRVKQLSVSSTVPLPYRRSALMETTAAVVCRGGRLRAPARGRATDRSARAERHCVGAVAASPAPATTARRMPLLVASLGEPLAAQSLSPHTLARSDSVIQLKPSHSIDHSVQVDADAEAGSTETLPPPDDVPTKTVHVKFVLQKRCAFGQRFLVVGEVPALGLWNPAKAAALDWSEDHVWTVKKELPAERSIEFKFLLQDQSGHVEWQHGRNRTLHVADTSNTLIVCEDWDEAKNQQVSEEIGDAHGIFSGSDGVFQEDELLLGEEQETNKGVTVGVDGAKSALVTDNYREMMGANDAIQPQLTLDKHQKIPGDLSGEANMAAQDGNHTATAAAAAGYAGSNGEDAILHKEGEPVENNRLGLAKIFVNDMAWTRKALHQLLRSLGFQIGTTKT
uniref:CBM20 domain-containing protein n=1 Tax=Oryza punctata TaxID=4537 RepID=A0A0E0JR80_ORYPU